MNKILSGRINRLSKKLKIINVLGGNCQNCGENNFYKLCLHHVNENKNKDFSHLTKKRWSVIEEEIKNCILLCNNCHRELHYEGKKNDKKLFLEFKGVKRCEKCGYDKCEGALEFHHRNPENKKFLISKYYLEYSSINNLRKEIQDEINKCDILCSNCHNRLHQNDGFYERYENIIKNKSLSIKEYSTKIDRELIRKLFQEGDRQIDISKKLNINRSLVNSIFKELNLPKKPYKKIPD